LERKEHISSESIVPCSAAIMKQCFTELHVIYRAKLFKNITTELNYAVDKLVPVCHKERVGTVAYLQEPDYCLYY
jgi:hypothetical protein